MSLHASASERAVAATPECAAAAAVRPCRRRGAPPYHAAAPEQAPHASVPSEPLPPPSAHATTEMRLHAAPPERLCTRAPVCVRVDYASDTHARVKYDLPDLRDDYNLSNVIGVFEIPFTSTPTPVRVG